SAWVPVNPGVAVFDASAQTITLNLTDDGIVADGDEDGAGTGTILDPGLPVLLRTPTVHVSDPGGIYNGRPVPAVATVAGVGGVSAPWRGGGAPVPVTHAPDAQGTVIAALPGQAPAAPGSYRVTATFPGTADYTSAHAAALFTIAPAATSVVVSASTTAP